MRWLLPLLLCAGCASQTDLAYHAPPNAIAAPFPLVAEVHVTDHRAEWPKLLATVSGFDDAPIKGVYVLPSVADGVADSFRSALAARGELAPAGQGVYDLNVTILELAAEQHIERQAHADLLICLVDRRTGRQAYSTRVYTETRGDNYLARDNLVFGSMQALGGLSRDVLDAAIDRTLDRGGFVIALR